MGKRDPAKAMTIRSLRSILGEALPGEEPKHKTAEIEKDDSLIGLRGGLPSKFLVETTRLVQIGDTQGYDM